MHESSGHADSGRSEASNAETSNAATELRVPADWEPQRRIWLAWPHNRGTWPGRFASIPEFFRGFARSIAESTPVAMIGDGSAPVAAEQLGADFLWQSIPTDDCWIRDYGPTFVSDALGRKHAIDWRYNAWGGKYDYRRDDRATAKIIESAGWARLQSNLCLEGGALEHNGSGILLTTSSCLLTETRNPDLQRSDIERELHLTMGCKEIVWVDGGGLAGDDTDGHIDQLVRFVGPRDLVIASCESDDENFPALEANVSAVGEWAAAQSTPSRVVRLPIPPARRIDGQRVPESYCNFLRLGPDRLLVPAFGDKSSDDRAAGLLRELGRESFPQMEVESIDCRDLIWGLGALHCASCNEPLLDG